jgi:hypothetical protein
MGRETGRMGDRFGHGAAPLAFSKLGLAEGTPPKLCFGGDLWGFFHELAVGVPG